MLFWDEGQFLTVPVLTQAFLVDNDGANHTYTSDGTFNSAQNSVECIGGGASGSPTFGTFHGCGGGGGAWNGLGTSPTLGANFNYTVPVNYRIGLGGAAKTQSSSGASAGNPGGDTWWNDTVFPTTGTNKLGAKAGLGGNGGTGSQNGGLGGASGSNYPAGGFSGGRGGNLTGASGSGASGGGGAAGSTGVGGNGGDSSATTTNVVTTGGTGDAGAGGAGGNTSGTNGSAGTEWDATHGSGGGGGTRAAGTPGGSGGLYGAGGGGSRDSAATTSGAGARGIIALTWTPATAISMTDMAIFCMP